MIPDDRPGEIISNPERTRPPGKRKLRIRLLIFLVCLIISTAMWLFIELMKEYTADIVYSVSFKNVPEDLILMNQEDSTLTVSVNAQGFELMVAQYLTKQRTLELDLSAIRLGQDQQGYTAIMPASRLLEQVERQLEYARSIVAVHPDTLNFRFSEVFRKKVPVLPDLTFSFENQYQLSDSVRVIPDRITVSSIRNVIDTIRFVSTQPVELTQLDSGLEITVPLRKALKRNIIRYSDDSVTIRVQVQKFTEAVFSIPVQVKGNSLPIRIFPDQVEVSCMVPLSQFREVDASGFQASVLASPNMLASNKKLQVILNKVPANIRSVRLKPEQVEYIIIAR